MSDIPEYTDLTRDLVRLAGPHLKQLAEDSLFIENAFDPEEPDILPPTPDKKVDLLMSEAGQALGMIRTFLSPGMRILEVGGGVGLVYALLRSKGHEVVSLEPGSQGFGDRHCAGLRLLDRLGIDTRGWLKQGIQDFSPGSRKFDLVFSYFVLEHLPDLNNPFAVMSGALKPGGAMVHCCPNYTFPYEPHYNIPLLPLWPRGTALLCPGLKNRGLWRGLNFITFGRVAGICSKYGLRPGFETGVLADALERVLNDSAFSDRKQFFFRAADFMRRTGLLRAVRKIPPRMATPMRFTARKTKKDEPE